MPFYGFFVIGRIFTPEIVELWRLFRCFVTGTKLQRTTRIIPRSEANRRELASNERKSLDERTSDSTQVGTRAPPGFQPDSVARRQTRVLYRAAEICDEGVAVQTS
jgi:hypothetical protein